MRLFRSSWRMPRQQGHDFSAVEMPGSAQLEVAPTKGLAGTWQDVILVERSTVAGIE